MSSPALTMARLPLETCGSRQMSAGGGRFGFYVEGSTVLISRCHRLQTVGRHIAQISEATRLPRARIIGDAVVWIGHTGDRWEDIAGKMWILDEGKTAPIWQIEGEGWTTSIMTRFCGLTCEVDVTSYDEDSLPVVAPRSDEVAVDVHYPEAGKVPLIGSTGDVDTLIVMQPGSWKTSFGVPHCEWSSAVARRLAPGISP